MPRFHPSSLNLHPWPCIALCLALAACSDSEKAFVPPPAKVMPLEDSQAIALEMAARRQAAAWSKRDGAEIAENITFNLLAERAFRVPGVLVSEVDPLTGQVLRQWTEKPAAGLGFGKDAQIKFLRRSERDGHPTAILRVAKPTGLFTYVDLIFDNTGTGERKIVDLYLYEVAAYQSQLVRLRSLPESGVSSLALLQATFGPDTPPEIASGVRRLAEAQRDGKWKDMSDALKAISGKAAEHPWTLVAQIRATLGQPGPGNPSALVAKPMAALADTIEGKLIQLEIGGEKKDLARLAEAAAVISLRMGGDGQAEAIRAGYHASDGKFAEAQAALDQGWSSEPDLLYLYETALAISIKAKDYRKGCEWIDRLEKGLTVTVDPQMLAKIPGFGELFRSPEFQEWMLKNNRH